MTRQLRGTQSVAAGAAAIAILLVAGLLGAAPRARAAESESKENISQYESQLSGNQVKSVVVNKRTRTLHVTLKDGTRVFAKYGKKQGPKYYAAVKAHHVPIAFLSQAAAEAEQSKHKPGHKIRYIAGGALIVVIAIVGGILYFNRRRKAALD